MKILWTPHAENDLEFWRKKDPKVIKRIKNLIESIKLDPHFGIGKPEQLKYDLKGYWSRRITGSHRLVYRVLSDRIEIVQCKYHY